MVRRAGTQLIMLNVFIQIVDCSSCIFIARGGVVGLQTYGKVPLEGLEKHPVVESNSRK